MKITTAALSGTITMKVEQKIMQNIINERQNSFEYKVITLRSIVAQCNG